MFSFASLFTRFLSLFCKEKISQSDNSTTETPPPLVTAQITPAIMAAICAGVSIHMENTASATTIPTPDVIAAICAGVSIATVDTHHQWA